MSEVENINTNELSEAELKILTAIKNIKFGAVEIHIHNSKVVQIEETNKFRF